MQALDAGEDWPLVHTARPGAALMAQGAHQRDDGLWVYRTLPARAAVGHGDAVGLRFRRAGHPLSRHDQPRQQPALLREDRRHQPLRRAAAAAVRLLRPRPGHPDALRAPSLRLCRQAPEFDFEAFADVGGAAGAGARQRAGPHLLAAARSSATRPWPSGASASASPAWATRCRCCACATTGRRAATWRCGSRGACATPRTRPRWRWRGRKGAFPAFKADGYLETGHLRQPAGRAAEAGHPRARHPQQPPAVDRAHRHREPGLRRQRVQRHRAGLLLDLPAPQARRRRQHHRVRRGRPRLAPLPRARRRHVQSAGLLRVGAGDAGGGPHRDDGGGAALRRHGDLQDRERLGGLSVRGFQEPLSRSLASRPEGTGHLPAQHHRRRRAAGQCARGSHGRRGEHCAAGPDVRGDRQAAQGRPAGGGGKDRVLDPGGQTAPVPRGVVHAASRRARSAPSSSSCRSARPASRSNG